MADEQYRWLDRDAAERLLRGEPLEAVDADTREQADRLADVLGTLAAEPTLNSPELPGEAAALAAFRSARADRDGERAQLGRRGLTHPAAHASDAGLVRLGRAAGNGRRARWGRPTRFGLAAVLAAGMLGGVAVAAGTGVLPTPFSNERPSPAASVTAAGTPEQPLLSPSPGASGNGGSQVPTPDGTTNGPSGGNSSDDDAVGGAASGQPRSDSTGTSGRTHDWWRRTRSSCRDVLDGKDLDAGRRRALEDVAGGSGRVRKYCTGILDRLDGNSAGQDGGDDKGSDHGGHGDQGDQGGDDDGNHILPGGNDDHDNGGILTPSPSAPALSPLLPRQTITTPTPTPTYSVLGLPTDN
ncbi:hypothetical protein GCM10011579_086950 [Streptomyces albiflavescens]|uniref:Extensin n=1 Tax=Streptomyces albiflavescens TaxID=1623582 RepID=A0A917YE64_9ACTN|nr:hypothetical protein [Streptomyces albiflavescens]GGN90739.1 hypothetical protein GCM10011579_086950 [Streptomyces albiflavescens]